MSSPAETRQGDILTAGDLQAIVNPVNCISTMGKGLARQFARQYPEILPPYLVACRDRTLTTERCLIHRLNRDTNPQYVVNLATKRNWRNPSRIQWIDSGLDSLYRQLKELNIASVGIPPLGAGLGGLNWNEVKAVINRHAERNPEVRTVIFLPRN